MAVHLCRFNSSASRPFLLLLLFHLFQARVPTIFLSLSPSPPSFFFLRPLDKHATTRENRSYPFRLLCIYIYRRPNKGNGEEAKQEHPQKETERQEITDSRLPDDPPFWHRLLDPILTLFCLLFHRCCGLLGQKNKKNEPSCCCRLSIVTRHVTTVTIISCMINKRLDRPDLVMAVAILTWVPRSLYFDEKRFLYFSLSLFLLPIEIFKSVEGGIDTTFSLSS